MARRCAGRRGGVNILLVIALVWLACFFIVIWIFRQSAKP